MIVAWVTEARLCLGTSKDTKAALDWEIIHDKGWWRKILLTVRTTDQFRYMKMFLDMAFRSKHDEFEVGVSHTGIGCTWDVTHCAKSFQIKWQLFLGLKNDMTMFKNPVIVPFTIGQILIPRDEDYYQYFHIGKSEITIPVEEGIVVMEELIYSLIERKFTKDESDDFRQKVNDFVYECSYDDYVKYSWTCSTEGILLIAGIAPETECPCVCVLKSILNSFFSSKFSDLMIRKVYGYLFDMSSIKRKKIYPFISVTGFGGIPDWLPTTKVPARSLIHFC